MRLAGTALCLTVLPHTSAHLRPCGTGAGAVGQLCKRGDDDEPLPVRVAAQARALAGRRVHQVGFGGQHGALVTVPAGQGPGVSSARDRQEGAPSAKRRR